MAIANRLPFPMTAWAVGLLMRLPQRGVVTVATNVPGPRRPLQIMGRRVLDLYPVSPIAMQLRTSVAMLSYADDLYFGILADYDVVADAGQLARGIEDAVARLVAISKRRKVTRRRGHYRWLCDEASQAKVWLRSGSGPNLKWRPVISHGITRTQ